MKNKRNYLPSTKHDVDEILQNSNLLQEEVNLLQNSLRSIIKDNDSQFHALKHDTELKHFDTLNSININTLHTKLPKGRKKILIVGFFGAKNLGDEMMLQELIKHLSPLPDYDLTIMLSDNYAPDLQTYQPFRTIHYPKNMTDLAELSRVYDAVVFPGGAVISDLHYSLTDISLDTIVVELGSLFIKNNKGCFIFGVSTEKSFSNQEYIQKLSFLVENSNYISLRDSHSLEVIKKLSIPTENIRIVDDIVLSSSIFNLKIKDYAVMSDKSSAVIGIFVFAKQNTKRIIRFINKILSLLPNDGTFTLVPFYDFNNNDINHIKTISSTIKDSRIKIIESQPANLEEFTTIIKDADLVISMRYHGTLIANILGKRVLCINPKENTHYVNKNKYIASHYRLNGFIIDEMAMDKFDTNNYNNLMYSKKSRVKAKTICSSAKKDVDELIDLIVNL